MPSANPELGTQGLEPALQYFLEQLPQFRFFRLVRVLGTFDIGEQVENACCQYLRMGRATRQMGPCLCVMLLAQAEENISFIRPDPLSIGRAEKNIHRPVKRPVDNKPPRVGRVRFTEFGQDKMEVPFAAGACFFGMYLQR